MEDYGMQMDTKSKHDCHNLKFVTCNDMIIMRANTGEKMLPLKIAAIRTLLPRNALCSCNLA